MNNCIDEPAIVERVRRKAPQYLVELGCGTGALTASILEHCGEIVAIDQSPIMIEMAVAEVAAENVNFVRSSFEAYVPEKKPAMVVSGMAMHLVSDIEAVVRRVFEWLEPGGTFVFSQRHPIRTANPIGDQAAEIEPSWTVSGYYDVGLRSYTWLGHEVQYYHRTVSDIVSAVVSAGFKIVEVDEPVPQNESFTERSAENRSSPAVLLVHCMKPLTCD